MAKTKFNVIQQRYEPNSIVFSNSKPVKKTTLSLRGASENGLITISVQIQGLTENFTKELALFPFGDLKNQTVFEVTLSSTQTIIPFKSDKLIKKQKSDDLLDMLKAAQKSLTEDDKFPLSPAPANSKVIEIEFPEDVDETIDPVEIEVDRELQAEFEKANKNKNSKK